MEHEVDRMTGIDEAHDDHRRCCGQPMRNINPSNSDSAEVWRCSVAGHENGERMMNAIQQNPNGSWSEAEPLPYFGWKAKTEQRFRRIGLNRLANLFAAWDERGLGK